MEAWANGNFGGDTDTEILVENAKGIEACRIFGLIAEMDYQQQQIEGE